MSLTSYPPRFDYLVLTLKSLLRQTVSPDKLIVWISEADKRLIPEEVLSLQPYGLTIRYCPDILSYKKLIPALQAFPEAFIVTADDDIYYPATWLENLVSEYRGNDKVLLCSRAHRIAINAQNRPKPYRQWVFEGGIGEPSSLNFPTSGAGVLFTPHVFNPLIFEINKALLWCPGTDDVWFYWMFRLNGVKARVIRHRFPLIEWPFSQRNALWKKNINGGQNDRAIETMCHSFGFFK